MKKYFLSLSRFYQIGACVLAAHCIAIATLCFHHIIAKIQAPKKPITIRTIIQPTPKITPVCAKGASNAKTSSLPLPSSAKPKKETKPPVPVKSSPPSTQAPCSNTQELLFKEISNQLDALAQPVKKNTSPPVVIALPDLPDPNDLTQTAVSDKTLSYGQACSIFLQNDLDLPELGQVVVHLVIDSKGNVLQVDIIETQNHKNSDFLKKRLPELSFPCFNEFGISKNHVDFTIKFRNAEDY